MSQPSDTFHARILIVDDQSSNIRLLEHTLRRGGYLAVTSTTEPFGVAALQIENSFDLIILDLQMPRMNGFEVMKSLEPTPAKAAPLILVMSADPTQRDRVLAAGGNSFLSKPYLLTDVLARVQSLLEHRTVPDRELVPA